MHNRCTCYKPAVAPPSAPPRFAVLLPAVLAASGFAFADVGTKVMLHDGAGVLTMALFRGFIGVPLLMAGLLVGAPVRPLSPPAFRLSLFVGALFAVNVLLLFMAIEAMPVPIAVLTYFTYPLLTGLAAAASGIERLGFAGAAAAIVAFAGLALIVGAHPGSVPVWGVACGLLSALTRVVILLLTRAKLQGTDARLVTLWSLIAATLLFFVGSLATQTYAPPQSSVGWAVLVGAGIAMSLAVLGVFISTARIGPFRTALFMNLEPLLATIGAALVLGELITPLQGLGGALMIGALIAFQMRR